MKRDEDVWISRGTKASRPDEFWPDQDSRVADRDRQDRRGGRGRTRANPDTPQASSPSRSDGNGDLRALPLPPLPSLVIGSNIRAGGTVSRDLR